MNKILIALGVVIIASGLYVGLSGGSKTNSGDNNPRIEQEVSGVGMPAPTQNTSGKKMAFEEFVKQGEGAWSCKVQYSVEQISSSGQVYVSNKNIRGNFTSTVQGFTVDTSFIAKDGMTYTWSSLSPIGFKAPVVEGKTTGGTETKGTISVDLKQIGDYDCSPWTVDEKLFVPPATITFKEA